jgi:hypothetical protein
MQFMETNPPNFTNSKIKKYFAKNLENRVYLFCGYIL